MMLTMGHENAWLDSSPVRPNEGRTHEFEAHSLRAKTAAPRANRCGCRQLRPARLNEPRLNEPRACAPDGPELASLPDVTDTTKDTIMRATSDTTTELQHHLSESLRLLRQLRDEIRVELHLAGMEAQDSWKALERKFSAVEKASHEVTEASRHLLQEAVGELKIFKDAVIKSRQEGKPSRDLSHVLPPFA